MTASPMPWERQPGESARAFNLFSMYRDLPVRQRSLSRLLSDLGGEGAAKTGRRRGDVERLSSRFRWVERAAQWDGERDRIRRAAMVNEQLEVAHRHALQGRVAANVCFWVLGKFWERVASSEADLEAEFGELTGPQLYQLAVSTGRALREAQMAEREAVGIVESRSPQPEPEPVADEDLISTMDRLNLMLVALDEAGYRPHLDVTDEGDHA